MPGKYPVITLCGSTRFKEQFFEVTSAPALARKSSMQRKMERKSDIWRNNYD